MAADYRLELVVEADTKNANASIKSVSTSLSGMLAAAVKATGGASAGIDSMTASMAKGTTAGHLLADAIQSALSWAKDLTVGSFLMAAQNAKAEASLLALTKATASVRLRPSGTRPSRISPTSSPRRRTPCSGWSSPTWTSARPRVWPSSPRTPRRSRT